VTARQREHPERGSVLLLLPAVVLVLLILGAIAVDSSVAYLTRRELADFTAGAADRAAATALDRPAFYGSGTVRVDPGVAAAVVAAAEAGAVHGGLDITSVSVTVGATGQSVTVTAAALAHTVFGVAAGGRRTFTVHAATTTDVEEVATRP